MGTEGGMPGIGGMQLSTALAICSSLLYPCCRINFTLKPTIFNRTWNFSNFKLFEFKQIFQLQNSNGFVSFVSKKNLRFVNRKEITNLLPICFARPRWRRKENGRKIGESRMVYPITRPRWSIHAHATNIIASYARVDTWMGSWPSVLAAGTVDRVRPIPADVSPPPGPELPEGVRFTIAPRRAMPRAFHRFLLEVTNTSERIISNHYWTSSSIKLIVFTQMNIARDDALRLKIINLG